MRFQTQKSLLLSIYLGINPKINNEMCRMWKGNTGNTSHIKTLIILFGMVASEISKKVTHHQQGCHFIPCGTIIENMTDEEMIGKWKKHLRSIFAGLFSKIWFKVFRYHELYDVAASNFKWQINWFGLAKM